MSDKYSVGSLVGTLRILERIPNTDHGKGKFRVVCLDCDTETVKWATSLYKAAKHGDKMCKVCRDRSYRRTDNWPALLRLYISYKSNAISRDISFEISPEEFHSIVQRNCLYCNAEPVKRNPPKEWQEVGYFSGIDRRNNLLGYVKENCVPCCYDCNRSKSDLGEEDFQAWCKRIASNEWWKLV